MPEKGQRLPCFLAIDSTGFFYLHGTISYLAKPCIKLCVGELHKYINRGKVRMNTKRRGREEATISFQPVIFEWIESKRGYQNRSSFVNAIIAEKMKSDAPV